MTERDRSEQNAQGSVVEKSGKEEKAVLVEGVVGTVKWFNVKDGYGFIMVELEGRKEDVFIHGSAIKKNNPKRWNSVTADEQVKFDIVQGAKGKEARNVTGPNGENVKGSSYARPRYFWTRRYRARTYYRYPRRSTKPDFNENETNEQTEEKAEDSKEVKEKPRRRPRRYQGRRRYNRNRAENSSTEEVEAPQEGKGDAELNAKSSQRRYRRNRPNYPRPRKQQEANGENKEESSDEQKPRQRRPRPFRGGYIRRRYNNNNKDSKQGQVKTEPAAEPIPSAVPQVSAPQVAAEA